MSTMQFVKRDIHLAHNGLTKDYDILIITGPNGKALMIRRWGKVETVGTCKTQIFGYTSRANNYAQKILDSKTYNGYDITKDETTGIEWFGDVWNIIPEGLRKSVTVTDWVSIGVDEKDILDINGSSESVAVTSEEEPPAKAFETRPKHYGTWS